MRLYIILALSVYAISTNSYAQLSAGLVAHWQFNGNANDVSGNGHNGNANNITYTTSKAGAINGAAKFNGQNSFISVPYATEFNVKRYTIVAIVKPEGFYQGTCQGNFILFRGREHNPGSYGLGYSDNAYNNCNTFDTTKHVFYAQAGNALIKATDMQSSQKVNTNKWYCVTAVYDSLSIKIYVDGVLASNAPVSSGTIGTSQDSITIGNYPGGGTSFPYWYNGIIDDIRLYDRALTPTEIGNYCSTFDTALAINRDLDELSLCSDDTFHLPYTVTKPFNSNNTFTAQLSNASGSFATPTVLGSVSSSTGGTIVCSIPTINTTSSNYKVRILASSPQRFSDEQHLTLYSSQAPSVSIAATQSGPYSASQFITFKSTVNNASGSISYQWKLNGTNIPNATLDSLYINTLNDGDSISVEIKDDNPCAGDLYAQSNIVVVKINTGINSFQLSNLLAYPNPTSGQFSVTADNVHYKNVDIDVLNATGQVVHKESVTITDNKLNVQLNLNNHAQGVYLLRLSADGIQRNVRFIKR